jgi:hypothetical protein
VLRENVCVSEYARLRNRSDGACSDRYGRARIISYSYAFTRTCYTC